MIFSEFKDRLFKEAKKAGFNEYEIYYEGGESLEINAYKKEIERYNLKKTMGISFRGLYNGKMGYAYTEIMDDEAVSLMVEQAKSNAEIIEKEDTEVIYGGSKHYEKFNSYNEKLHNISADEKIKLALKLEEEIYKSSDKVINTEECSINTQETETRIINSKGLDLRTKSNAVIIAAVPIVQQGENVNNGIEFSIENDMNKVDINKIAKDSVEDGLAKFGASSVKSGKYRVIFRNSASAMMLLTFAGIFSADNAQKGLSLLKGKVGENIGSSALTIVDDPFVQGSLFSTPFDAEGVAAYRKNVVEKGQLKTLLHNLKTAAKDGVKSTGNASKSSYASPIEVAPTNLCIEPGTKSYEELVKTLGSGVIITDVEGTHAGANAVSGDFSLSSKGFLVEGGKIVRPVEQITVAGNYYELMKNVEEAASDVKMSFPMNFICYSPSILIKELSIAGE